MKIENWKPVPGFEGHYEVSDLGQVRSVDYYIIHRIANRTRKGTLLKPRPAQHGYLRVALFNRAKRREYSIHYLVALAFHPSKFGCDEVNHINGIKFDNRAENLEWSSRKDNMEHAVKSGLIKRPLNPETVIAIRLSSLSHEEEARVHGIGGKTVSRIRSGKTYKIT